MCHSGYGCSQLFLIIYLMSIHIFGHHQGYAAAVLPRSHGVSIPIMTVVLESYLCDGWWICGLFQNFLDSLIMLSRLFLRCTGFFSDCQSLVLFFSFGREEFLWTVLNFFGRIQLISIYISQGSDNTIILPTNSM